MRKPTDADLRAVREFQEILTLPLQERRLAVLKDLPESTDPADCICKALKRCAKTDNPCPYCRTIDRCTPDQKVPVKGASHE